MVLRISYKSFHNAKNFVLLKIFSEFKNFRYPSDLRFHASKDFHYSHDFADPSSIHPATLLRSEVTDMDTLSAQLSTESGNS